MTDAAPLNKDGSRNPLVFDTTPQTDKDGVVTLSADIQAEQKAAGCVPDVQPKSAPQPATGVEPGTRVDATGNVAVAAAVAQALASQKTAP